MRRGEDKDAQGGRPCDVDAGSPTPLSFLTPVANLRIPKTIFWFND